VSDKRPLETGWLPDTPPNDNLVRRFTLSQAQFVSDVASAHGGRVETHDDVSLADAASVVPYYNQAVLLRPVTKSDDPVLDRTSEFYAAGDRDGHPWTVMSVWPTPDLNERGWTLVGHPALVVRSPSTRPERAAPDDVRIELVDDAERLAIAERVTIEGYPIEEAAGLPTGSTLPPAMLGGPVSVRLGVLDGDPVAVGMGHVSNGVVNLCLGATLPAARRRGVWEALVWARVDDAPDLPTVAYTSDFSRPGFERMGFLVVTRVTLWAGA
jgi:hypothetical protein